MMKKVVLITGASKGLGKALAGVFGEKGYHLILNARSNMAKIGKKFNSTIVTGDLTKNDTIEKLGKAVSDLGRLDILINNAGMYQKGPFLKLSEKEFDDVMSLNFKSQVFLTQELLPIMIKQESGHIFNIVSTAAIDPKSESTIYTASKFALNGFTTVLRMEVKKHGIKVTAFHPGGMRTNMHDRYDKDNSKSMDPEQVAEFVFDICNTKNISPDDIVLTRMSKY